MNHSVNCPLGRKNFFASVSVVLGFLIHSFSAFSQYDSTLTFSLGYYGNNLWNPGFSFDTDYTFRETKADDDKSRSYLKQLSAQVKLAGYADPNIYQARFVQAGFRYRKIKPRGFYCMLGISPLGLYRSFLPETYQVSSKGDVTKITIPGRWYFAPEVSAGLGKVTSIQNPTGVYAHIHLMVLMPYNTYVLPLLNVELGYQFAIKFRRK
ncbi:MAG: hypothetical protein R3D00_23855 [Bacteroidia bacterium]